MSIDINSLSKKDLKALEKQIEERKEAERKERLSARKKYEVDKEKLINDTGERAQRMAQLLSNFKTDAFAELIEFKHKMLEYGDIRNGEDNKGNFIIKNDRFKIDFKTQAVKSFDERAQLAATKLDQFLQTFIKKGGAKFYKLISTAIQINEKTGKFDPDAVNRLYSIEDEFDNPLWLDGLKLFKESYQITGTACYIGFFVKDKNNKWHRLLLDFASAQIREEKEVV